MLFILYIPDLLSHPHSFIHSSSFCFISSCRVMQVVLHLLQRKLIQDCQNLIARKHRCYTSLFAIHLVNQSSGPARMLTHCYQELIFGLLTILIFLGSWVLTRRRMRLADDVSELMEFMKSAYSGSPAPSVLLAWAIRLPHSISPCIHAYITSSLH